MANGQRLSTTGNQGSFVVTYNGSGDVVLSNFALAGDYKANGIVDAGDYVLWRKSGQLRRSRRLCYMVLELWPD